MSQWTHVIGIVQTSPRSKEEIEDAFGVPCTWNDLVTKAFLNHRVVDTKIPTGSEGSIDWRMVDTTELDPDGDPMLIVGEGLLITFEGDLRNFGEIDEDVQEIARWFIEGCKKIEPRWATLSIDVEWGAKYNINFKWDRWSISKIDRTKSLAIEDLHVEFGTGED